ncbi:LytR/AlgR family response regulator transcription factor [Flagellimonas meridianipacifica]|uniref:DNA-binding LytR/AlgR family response regulator n=1 Tax=Flagellimonas meridianipacifica TaxID=1080225 RepID=A0A2T0MBQ3_9FLAO|nr:LytTR family DNA-binding domain-containing protein [Allomuricauda pacifica]PRX54920.1 DNA-binding LytR/AlgR family response regulator [Allomuricauda pacifica]
MIKVVIVDDEPLASEGLASYVRELDTLQLVGTCENPIELMTVLEQHSIDLIFLDIQMPKMSGLDFIKIKKNLPYIVITTAYPNYAVEGFNLNVTDYLLKPITFERFVQAVNKVLDLEKQMKAVETSHSENHFFIRSNGKYEKIYFSDIEYIQGLQNYVTIFTSREKYTTLLTLKQLETNLDAEGFVRVHKSFIVSLDKINSIENHEIRLTDKTIPVSKNYRDLLMEKVVKGKLWKR